MSEQQYIKNNDKPSADSVLWEFADDWKTSQQSGQSYASLPGVERVNDELYEGLRDVIKSKKLEDVEYQSYFLALTLFPNKDKTQKDPNKVSNWHVFAFENKDDAVKKVEQQKKFIKWDLVSSVPKPTTTTTTTSSSPPQTKLNTTTNTTTSQQSNNIHSSVLQHEPLTTFTDLQIVDIEQAKTLEQSGYYFLPSTLLRENHWKEDIYNNEDGTVDSKHLFAMGRIINVKITDK